MAPLLSGLRLDPECVRIFALFIVYDTNNIMKHLGVDDYIIAAIELYLDVVNLFRYLLICLAIGGSRE